MSAECGCEESSGVTRSGFWKETTSKDDCQQKCTIQPGCVAVDYKRYDGWCNWYRDVCLTPAHKCGRGWSHYRKRGVATQQPISCSKDWGKFRGSTMMMFFDSFLHQRTFCDKLIHTLAHSLTHQLTHSLTHYSLARLLIHSLIRNWSIVDVTCVIVIMQSVCFCTTTGLSRYCLRLNSLCFLK